MAKLTPGQIYLADQRGEQRSDTLLQYCTLNYGEYFDEQRKAIGPPEFCNDNTLAAGKELAITNQTPGFVIIIPVTGEIIYRFGNAQPMTIDVGEVYICYLAKDVSFTLTNPYDGDWINFLHLHVASVKISTLKKKFTFDFEAKPDQLIDLLPAEDKLPFKLSIGQFAGRNEALYQLKSEQSTLFAFVIAGAFEMQGRLLHQRDALALWQLPEADIEALSNGAVILVMEA